MSGGFVTICKWEKFQQYKDRRPTWIKAYVELLDHYDFSSLPDATKAHLFGLWLLAAATDNKIPNDPDWIARRINATTPIDLALLKSRGFIQYESPRPSVRSADDDCSLEERREEEEERRADPDLPLLLSLEGEPFAPPSATPPKATKAARESWLTGYGEDWRARWGVASEPPFKQLAGTIRKAHDEHGESKLRAAWRAYLASEAEAKWAKPATFVQGLGQWLGPRPVLVPARASPRVPVTEQNRAVLDQWEADVAEGKR